MPSFEPPTTTETYPGRWHRAWTQMKYTRGRTVIKESGVFSTIDNPSVDRMNAADSLTAGDTSQSSVAGKAVWLGGYVYEVSTSVRTELTNNGYA